MQKHATPGYWLFWGALCTCAAAVLLRPQLAAAGVTSGLRVCAATIIPTMFPFLVLSRLILEGPGGRLLGLPLRPLTRLMGIQSPKSSGALLCGWAGGFAAGAKSIGDLHRSGELSARDASLLLTASTVSGPAFVVGSVGTMMLGSTQAGWILFAAQLLASAACGLLCSLAAAGRPDIPAPEAPVSTGHVSGGFAAAVADGVQAVSVLCGYVTLFSFLAAIAVPRQFGAAAQYLVSTALEVTTACLAASSGPLPHRVLLCAAAISVMGVSVFVQVRAFAGREISLRPLFWSRLLHLPLMLGLCRLLLKWFPSALEASAPAGGYTTASRMPLDAACVLFVLCALVLCGKNNGLRRRSKEL